MKNYILCVLVLLSCCICTAMPNNPIKEGNMIYGHVIEKHTENDIPYATILLVGTDMGTTSNELGMFEFSKLKPGKYTLRVSAVGYVTQEKTVEVNSSYTTQLHIMLEE